MAERQNGEGSRIEWLWQDPGARARLARALLLPASALFGAVVRVRNALYDRRVLPVRTPRIPALSVGNLTVGGTGKTPVSSWLAVQLEARGAHPAIVMRGYGDDEPLVHARLAPTIPVIVNANRFEAIERAAAQGADVAVLDDAFQHRAVARAADVVLISADAPDGAGATAPERSVPGARVRAAPRDARHRDAQGGVARSSARRGRSRIASRRPTCRLPSCSSRSTPCTSEQRASAPLASLRGRRVLAIAGVGNAARSASSSRRPAPRATACVSRSSSIHGIGCAVARARRSAATRSPICTLKDAVKLAPLWPREARGHWLCFPSRNRRRERERDRCDPRARDPGTSTPTLTPLGSTVLNHL